MYHTLDKHPTLRDPAAKVAAAKLFVARLWVSIFSDVLQHHIPIVYSP